MFINAFPKQLKHDVEFVSEHISLEKCNKSVEFVSQYSVFWRLKNGESIYFPDRIYLIDKIENPNEIFSPVQEMIYHCIFSRSYDGYVREKHIAALLKFEIPDWVVPYILKICDEYVLKILDMVYSKLSETDTSAYREICKLNPEQFALGHSRMISYWNEYYRDKCCNFRDYVGKKLYEECFGYVKSMEDNMCAVHMEKADINDIEQLIGLRTAYLIEDYGDVPQEQLAEISQKLPDYFRRHLNKDCFVYAAKSENEIVSCCFLVVSEKPSNPSFINGVVGTVMNVYTKPDHRRKGLAGKLMKMLLEDSEKMGLDFVELKATDSGYRLYRSLGFEDSVSKYHNMKIAFDSAKKR